MWSSVVDSDIDLASDDVILDLVIAGRWEALLMRRLVFEDRGVVVVAAADVAARVLKAARRVMNFMMKD